MIIPTKYLKFSKNPSNPLSRILRTQTIKWMAVGTHIT